MQKLKSKNSSQSNPEIIFNNTLNNSISKMQYSFSKANRFTKSIEKTAPYYSIPSTLVRRATSFGMGNKMSFQDRRIMPPPNKYYYIKNCIGYSKQGISFGESRQKVKNSSVFIGSNNPGPGHYYPKTLNAQSSWTLTGRLPDKSMSWKIKIPGPGSYKVPETINVQGKYVNSKYVNSKCPVISNCKVQRMKTQPSPGPNHYDPKILNSKCEKSLNQTRTVKFGRSKRLGIYELNKNPGPGQYNHFTEFKPLVRQMS